jgi:hypothetical protein
MGKINRGTKPVDVFKGQTTGNLLYWLFFHIVMVQIETELNHFVFCRGDINYENLHIPAN